MMRALVLICMLCGCLRAAEPLFETNCLFALTPQNKPNYRIPSIIVASNGDLLVICEKRNDGPGDIGNHDIVMKRSSDNGKTWSDEIVVLDDEDRVCTDITVGLDRDTKKLWLFFLKDKKQFAHLTSTDNGLTWNGPTIIHDQVTKPEWDHLTGKPDAKPYNPKSHTHRWEHDWYQRYGCGPGHAMVQLKSGRLLVPARHREDTGKGRLRSFAHCFYSDDHGATWHLGGTIGLNTSECQFVELNDGAVRVISRNESAEDAPDNLRHLTSLSHDGGVTWSELQRLEELITPRCHGSVERFDAKTLLFCSPASPFRQEEHPYGRYNLTVRLSHDDGASWSAGRTLWPHPGSYSDIAVLDDGSIGLVYERGDKGSTHYWDELHFARFNLEWLTNGPEKLHRMVPQTAQDLQSLLRFQEKRLPCVSAHRGGPAAGFPENCIATFEHTLKHTFALLEVDPRRTKDGAIVLHHDATLERTSTGTGKVSDHTLAELKQLRLKDAEGAVTSFSMPTLDEAVEWARGKTVLVLDQKDITAVERAEIVTRHKAEAHVMLIVSSFADAAAVHRLNPNILMEVMIPTVAKAEEFDRLGIPWKNVVVFVGHNPPDDPALYAFIHRQQACCMIGTSRNLDRDVIEKKVASIRQLEPRYRDFLGRGADLIETDIPVHLGPLLFSGTLASAPGIPFFEWR